MGKSYVTIEKARPSLTELDWLWMETELNIQVFSLVVNNYGVKYVGEEHANHIVDALDKHYEILKDCEGKNYCGLTLEWYYVARKVHVSMTGYVKDALQRFKHDPLPRIQNQPYPHTPP